MSRKREIEPDPSVIGTMAKPPFVRLPEPLRLFVERTLRLRALAEGHQLAPYLRFLSDLTEAQYRIQDDLPEPEMPTAETLARAKEHKMPPLDRHRYGRDPALAVTLDRLISLLAEVEMPETAKAALGRLAAADTETRERMILAVLADAIPIEEMAEHVLVTAALQVHYARLAARLDKDSLDDIGDGVCPSCGGPPTASMVVGWQGAEGTRFCSCSLCATLWNYVRVKCTVCGSTKEIAYQEVDGAGNNVKAETCGSCRTYVKVMYQQKDAAMEPVADDVASLALDILVRDLGFTRGGVNPFLHGY